MPVLFHLLYFPDSKSYKINVLYFWFYSIFQLFNQIVNRHTLQLQTKFGTNRFILFYHLVRFIRYVLFKFKRGTGDIVLLYIDRSRQIFFLPVMRHSNFHIPSSVRTFLMFIHLCLKSCHSILFKLWNNSRTFHRKYINFHW